MTSKKAQAAFEALNERQRTWLLVIYKQDQAAEESAKSAWTRGQASEPASVWRWLQYGLVDVGGPVAQLGELQLRSAKVWDQGAGSTITVLEDRGLIETKRTKYGTAPELWIKLTTAGRAAARAGGEDDKAPARSRPNNLLTDTLWSMLAELHRAGDRGITRARPGAWQKLTDRSPALASIEPAGANVSIRIAPEGVMHYHDHWTEYATLYPAVRALPPQGSKYTWPTEVDRQLWKLREAVGDLATELRSVYRVRTGELSVPKASQGETPEQVAARRLRSKLVRLDAQIHAELDRVHDGLVQLHRVALGRYVAVAAAVTAAVAQGIDPRGVMAQEPVELTADNRLPDPAYPKTGVAGVDREIAAAHKAAHQWQRRDRSSRPSSEPGYDLQAAAVHQYADHLRQLVEGGQLVRLLLRRDG